MLNLNTIHKALPCLLLGLVTASAALSAEMPKRKPGLWEIHTHIDKMPSGPPIQMCIDQSSDNLMQQRSKEKSSCGVPDIKKTSGGTTIHTVCHTEDSTMTIDAVYTGSFDTGYQSDMKMRYTPPLHGMSETHMVQEAKWLSACKPGQKPGDVVMHNSNFNMNDMMQDTHLQEMMQRRQQGQ